MSTEAKLNHTIKRVEELEKQMKRLFITNGNQEVLPPARVQPAEVHPDVIKKLTEGMKKSRDEYLGKKTIIVDDPIHGIHPARGEKK